MRRTVLFMLGSLALSLCAHAASMPKDLAEVITTLPCEGSLTPILVLSENAFPIAQATAPDGTVSTVAAGATYGKGRVIYLGDAAPLLQDKTPATTATFYRQALAWLAKGKKAPKVAVFRQKCLLSGLQRVGIQATLLEDLSRLSEYDVLVAKDFPPCATSTITTFVKKGGSLLGRGCNLCGQEVVTFACKRYQPCGRGGNNVLAPMGLMISSGSAVAGVDGGCSIVGERVPPAMRVDEALSIAIKGTYADEALRRQVAKTLAQFAVAVPSTLPQTTADLLMEFAQKSGIRKIPSPATPIAPEDAFARLTILGRKLAYQRNPEKAWGADLAASVYPGLVKPGTKPISRTIEIDSTIPHWHSTGLFAPAGQTITVKLPKSAGKWNLRLRIGTTQDDLSDQPISWTRFPLVTTEIPINQSTVKVTSPFGGLIYLVLPEEGVTACRRFEITVEGGIMAPWFKLGRSTAIEFFDECRETGAPQGELEGMDFILTYETPGLVHCLDPEWTIAYWDLYLELCQKVAGLPIRPFPARLCRDIQLKGSGAFHGGYPMMSLMDLRQPYTSLLDRESLEQGRAWAYYSAIGGNHINPAWIPTGMADTLSGLFALAGINTLSRGELRRADLPTAKAASQAKLAQWVKAGKDHLAWQNDLSLSLEFYVRLIEVYGWDKLTATLARYHQPGFVVPRTDVEKWNTFAREYSEVTGQNIARVMQAWSLPISKETLDACAQKKDAPASLTEGLLQ